ncbi:hypothetical protein CP061683_1946 [Chlamydia psittaci 06-1683]|nr:hypothetical protein CP061683_1946 [Chlamydia psittaci 06-1683]
MHFLLKNPPFNKKIMHLSKNHAFSLRKSAILPQNHAFSLRKSDI